MSSRPSRPDTREVNCQACLAFTGDRSNCSGLVSDFLTIPAGSPFSTLRALKPTGRKSAYARPGTSGRSRTARLTDTAHLPSRRQPRAGSSMVAQELPPRDHRHAGHQNAVLEATLETVAPVRIGARHLHRRPARSRRKARSAHVL